MNFHNWLLGRLEKFLGVNIADLKALLAERTERVQKMDEYQKRIASICVVPSERIEMPDPPVPLKVYPYCQIEGETHEERRTRNQAISEAGK